MARDPKHPLELLLSAARSFQQTRWQPPVDVYRTERGWLLKYELAGVLPDEVQLSVSGRRVVVRGARRDIRIDERRESYCMEIAYNQFERAVDLPCELDDLALSTEYHDGMLIVRLMCKEP